MQYLITEFIVQNCFNMSQELNDVVDFPNTSANELGVDQGYWLSIGKSRDL